VKGLILLAQLACHAVPLPNGGCQWCCESETVSACRTIARCETEEQKREKREYQLQREKNRIDMMREQNKAEQLRQKAEQG